MAVDKNKTTQKRKKKAKNESESKGGLNSEYLIKNNSASCDSIDDLNQSMRSLFTDTEMEPKSKKNKKPTVYSTENTSREENEIEVKKFISRNPECVVKWLMLTITQ